MGWEMAHSGSRCSLGWVIREGIPEEVAYKLQPRVREQ